jgi:hypothetical protein
MTDDSEALLEKLRGIVDGEKSADLTDTEKKRLRQMIAAYDTLLAGGKLGRWVMGTVIFLGASIAATIKLLEYIVQAGGRAP